MRILLRDQQWRIFWLWQRDHEPLKLQVLIKLITLFLKNYLQGKILLFVSSLMSGFCVSDIELVCVVSTFSSMMRFSPVVSSVSSSAYKLCFVFDALLVYESSSESE